MHAADVGLRFFFFIRKKVALCTEQLALVSIIYIPDVGRQGRNISADKRPKDYLERTRLEASGADGETERALNFNPTAAHLSDTFFTSAIHLAFRCR